MKFDELYIQLIESMDRRDFLKWLTKGAAVAFTPIPKGIAAAASSIKPAIIDTDKAIIDFYGFNGSSAVDMKNAFINMLSALKQKGATFLHDKPLQNSLANFYKNLDTNDMEIIHGELQDITFGMLDDLHKGGFLTPKVVEHLSDMDIQLGHYIDDIQNPKSLFNRREDNNKNKKKYNELDDNDINYSRLDKAGSSEDEGYARYYESRKFLA